MAAKAPACEPFMPADQQAAVLNGVVGFGLEGHSHRVSRVTHQSPASIFIRRRTWNNEWTRGTVACLLQHISSRDG